VAALSLRRFYLGQRRLALADDDADLAAAWRAKQEAMAWPALPADFPKRAALAAALYTTVRDLDGATAAELERTAGLTPREAAAVLAALEQWHMIPCVLASYQRQDGRAAAVYSAPLAPSAARTVSASGDVYEMGDLDTLRLTLDVTAIVGTLDVIVETSQDGATDWKTLFTFGQKSATGTDFESFGGAARFVRVSWTIGTSATFSVTGEAC